jgi:hypothetical protein
MLKKNAAAQQHKILVEKTNTATASTIPATMPTQKQNYNNENKMNKSYRGNKGHKGKGYMPTNAESVSVSVSASVSVFAETNAPVQSCSNEIYKPVRYEPSAESFSVSVSVSAESNEIYKPVRYAPVQRYPEWSYAQNQQYQPAMQSSMGSSSSQSYGSEDSCQDESGKNNRYYVLLKNDNRSHRHRSRSNNNHRRSHRRSNESY